MAAGNSLYYGIPLQQASQYVGILDMILGAACTIILVVDATRHSNTIGIYIPIWLTIVLVNAFATEAIMGIVLLFAASNKSRSIIKFWLCTTALIAIFTGLPIRVYEMLIVSEFSEELKKIEGVEHITGESSSSSSQPRGAQRASPNDLSNHNGGDGAGAPPIESVNRDDDGSQYARQLPYNPASQIQNVNPSVPPALLPPPQSDVLAGVGGGCYAGLYPNPNIT